MISESNPENVAKGIKSVEKALEAMRFTREMIVEARKNYKKGTAAQH